ncbi:MAG: MBL fold metallo-hydrolase [Patescibacteria group bacterium]|nr:MBL fold metallo-hydrolase [Patescibacteria group bacterium]
MRRILIISMISAAFLLFSLRFGYGLGVDDSVEFFDIGQGDSSLVSCGRAQMLIDGGPDRIVLNRLGHAMPFFDRRIEYLLLSHPHEDHVFGLFAVLDRYDVGRVLISEYAAEEWRGRDFIRFAESKGIEVLTVSAGDSIELCPGMRMDIVWPDRMSSELVKQGRDEVNDLSVVGRLVALSPDGGENRQSASRTKQAVCLSSPSGDKANISSVLFTGDITATAEQAILDSGADISACVLKVPHHGSRYSSTPEFLLAVSPELSVIQVGENRHGQPSFSTILRLEASGSVVHRTDIDRALKMY